MGEDGFVYEMNHTGVGAALRRLSVSYSAVVVAFEGGENPGSLLGVKAQGEGDVTTAAKQVFGDLGHVGGGDPRGRSRDAYRRNGLTVFVEDRRTHTAN